jgi:dihydrofolate reductase
MARELVYYIGVSIDGRIAGPRGEYDFFPMGDGEAAAGYSRWTTAEWPETVPTAYRDAAGVTGTPNKHFDTVVMGLGTYRPALDEGITSPYAHLRQYVVSSTTDPATDPAVTIVPGDPLGLVRRLKAEDGLDIWLCGGGKLAGTLFPEVDRLVVKRYPVVVGAGIPVFDRGFEPAPFRVTDRRAFDNGVEITWFARG